VDAGVGDDDDVVRADVGDVVVVQRITARDDDGRLRRGCGDFADCLLPPLA